MSRPIKILHALGTLNPGGVEVWLLSLLKSLDTNQFQFDFCTLGSEAGLYADEAQGLGAVIHRCPRFPIYSLGPRFRKILRQDQYDVVHSHVHLFSGALLRWAQTEKVPVRIAHSHASHDDNSDRPLRRYYRRLMQGCIERHSTHGLAASQIAGKELFAGAWQQDHRFRVLHYGIDLARFQSAFSKDQIRKELGIPIDAPVVGHVGRFVKAKNHHFLLKIAAEILKLRPDIHFLLVGDGLLKDEIEKQSRAMRISPNVHFPGARNDIPRLMQGCMDAFVLPSLWEGFGLVLIEAQAAGLPCTLSDSISEETSVFHQRIFRLPLSKDAKEWAMVIINSLRLRHLTSEETLSTLDQTDFSIRQSSAVLTQLYASATQTLPNLNLNEVEPPLQSSTNQNSLGPSIE
jgi:glycosyltransferase involved in cell wall biosynthesis